MTFVVLFLSSSLQVLRYVRRKSLVRGWNWRLSLRLYPTHTIDFASPYLCLFGERQKTRKKMTNISSRWGECFIVFAWISRIFSLCFGIHAELRNESWHCVGGEYVAGNEEKVRDFSHLFLFAQQIEQLNFSFMFGLFLFMENRLVFRALQPKYRCDGNLIFFFFLNCRFRLKVIWSRLISRANWSDLSIQSINSIGTLVRSDHIRQVDQLDQMDADN